MVKEYKLLAKEFNKLKTDLDRLAFLKQHNDKLTVILDDDCTHVAFIEPEGIDDDEWDVIIMEIHLNGFDNCHGWTDGIIELFEFAGITAESC